MTNKSHRSVSEIILISSSISFLLYHLFYAASGFIWNYNSHYRNEGIFLPWVTNYFSQQDGIEGYVLYLMMFVNLSLTLLITRFISKLNFKPPNWIWMVFLFSMYRYFYQTGFFPAQPDITHNVIWLILLLISASIILKSALLLFSKSNNMFLTVVFIALIPLCFISTTLFSRIDYEFIWAPALRMYYGVPISQIYFQYDLLFSLFALLWMKLHLDLNTFQILGQASLYLLLLSLFFFSKNFFKEKKLAVYLLTILIIEKIYALLDDPTTCIQVSPLRLDLWIILLLIIHKKGIHHFLIGMIAGVLLLIHKNFGLIYLGALIQLNFILFLVEYFEKFDPSGSRIRLIFQLIKKHLHLNVMNMLIVFFFFLVGYYLYGGFMPESALLYQKLGIGMLPISRNSIYWLVPIIISSTFVILLQNKNSLGEKYFATSVFLLLIAIGNSLYFFGRSHPNNILNISAILILVYFVFIDVILFNVSKHNFSERLKIRILKNIPFITVLIAVFFCSASVGHKGKMQLKSLLSGEWHRPASVPTSQKFIKSLKENTRASSKVYFLDYLNDFNYYYYGGYEPLGYYNPAGTWVRQDEYIRFMQNLLDKDYYIAVTNEKCKEAFLPLLNYTTAVTDSENEYTVIKNDPRL